MSGFEAGAYLKFIVDNYDSLPEILVFTQADAEDHIPNLEERIQSINVDNLAEFGGYMPINDQWIASRTLETW